MESSLRERWQAIEQMEGSEGDHIDKRYLALKEQWFRDAYEYLMGLPKDSHFWCEHTEVTGPLLEPFAKYFKDEEKDVGIKKDAGIKEDTAIKKLWRRMSSELRRCTWCIRIYYEQKAFYKMEFVESAVKRIFAVLQVLDTQRITTSMQEIMQNKVADIQNELMAVLYELFSYHEMVEDPQINNVMVSFLQQITISHDLELSNQPYPGLYALLFHCNQDVRRVALKLVKGLKPFSNAEELEPYQPILEKRMKYLDNQLENKGIGITKESLWLGMRTMLSFIKPPAIEEGIVERYPAFIGIVLNHVSENSKVFFDALSCLGLLLEALGYNLWQKCAFSPSVLRNTLLSQCFHTKDERTHKAVFEVFLHFLQSLESMQDGQYERQRRYLLYFLLHQVPYSNNFSSLTRKNACSTACSILIRSYKMDPPAPPFECAHFWGPMIVSTIMNSGLQLPFRERAMELLELLLVADAAALSTLYYKAGGGKELFMDDGYLGEEETLVNTGFSWSSYIQQIELECENWCCVPLVWSGVLESTSVFPSSSLTRAFIVALSRLSVIDERRDGIFSEKVAAALHWETPKGCDDGADGKGCSNAVRANGSQLPELISIFRRCADSFTKKIREQGLFADWSWDSMGESLLLLHIDSSQDFRKLGKDILQQFTKDTRLDYGVQFLLENPSSVIKAFSHAVKLLTDKPFEQCLSLRQVFFMASKFLNAETWSFRKNFGQKLSRVLWPLLVKSIIHGKGSTTATGYESCCAGMFELLPVVFKYTIPSTENDTKQLDGFWKVDQEGNCPVWFQELAKWADTSSNTIRRKWNDAILSILEDLARGPVSAKAKCCKTVDDLLQPESVLDNDRRQSLLLLFSSEQELKIKPPSFSSVSAHQPLDSHDGKKAEGNIVEPQVLQQFASRPIVIEPKTQVERDVVQPLPQRDARKEDTQRVVELAAQIRQQQEATRGVEARQEQTASKAEIPRQQHKRPSVRKIGKSTLDAYFTGTQRVATPKHVEKPKPSSPKPVEKPKAAIPRHVEKPPVVEHAPKRPVTEKIMEIRREEVRHPPKEPVAMRDPVGTSNQTENTEEVLKELVSDYADPFEAALDNARKQRISSATTLAPKRTVIKLDMPGGKMLSKGSLPTRNKFRLAQRPPPPKMDDWLMRVLSFDFFMDGEDTGEATNKLVEVPMTFTSPEHYMDVFRPLLIEEFKAQLQRSREEVDVEDKERVGMVSLISMERVDDMHTARFLSEAGKDGPSRTCVENDLLLISRHPFQESMNGVHLLAKVERRERENKGGGTIIYVKIYLSPKSERLSKAKRLLINRSRWHITKLMSITPQLREFQAVSAMAYSPLVEVILSPVAPRRRPPDIPVNLPDGLWRKLKSDYNESQVAAIRASIGDPKGETHQISLVQGPPGTGKTKTIVAIVSALIQMGRSDEEDRNNRVEPRRVGYHAAIAQGWQNAYLARQLMQDEQQRTKKSHARVLVCAQSNAAVDELVARLCKNGIYNSSGQFYKPTIVRAGNASSIHADSMPYFIDKLVDKRLQEERGRNTLEDMEIDTTDWHAKLEQITEKINEVVRKISEGAEEDAALNAKLVQMEKQRKQYTMEVQKSLQQSKKTIEADKIRKKKMRSEIIREADIVLTTLSGCGGDIYSACMEVDKSSKQCEVLFDAVVIDEAGQALEPATLIPLQLLAGTHGRCVMVGDPKQLPATVLSQAANRFLFERSMFERFQTNGFPVTMLTIQYRMHPEIRRFPSLHFYDDQLVDGSSVLGNNRLAAFHKDKLFRPYAFLDVSQGQEVVRGSLQSIANMEEVEVAVELFKCFQARYPGEVKPGRIGIITPYKRQLCSLKDSFTRHFGAKIQSTIEFNTIDGFQGREVDILILSTVRASQQDECKGIGFVADIRRMNVALTRAKFSLWIIGNAKALSSNRAWASLLEDATSRGVFFPVLKPYKTFSTTTPTVVTPTTMALQNRDGNVKVTPEVSTKKRTVEQIQENVSKRQKVHNQDGLNKQPERMEVEVNEVNENFEKHPSRLGGEDQSREREDGCSRRREEDQRRQREQDQSRRREEDQSHRRTVNQSRGREDGQNRDHRRRRDEDHNRRRDEDYNRRKDDRRRPEEDHRPPREDNHARWKAEDQSHPRNDSRDRRIKFLDEHRDPQKRIKVLDSVHKDKQSQLLSQIVDDEPRDRRKQLDAQKREGSTAIPKQTNSRDYRNPDSLQQTNISGQQAPKILDRNAIERKRLEERRKNRDEVHALMGGSLLDTRRKSDVSATRPTVHVKK